MTPTQRKHRKYDASPKGKARMWRYRRTARGAAAYDAAMERYLSKLEVKEHRRWLGVSWRRSRRMKECAV